MQAIRNKLTGKSKRNLNDKKRSSVEEQSSQNLAVQPLTPAPSVPGAVVTNFVESHNDLPSGTHVDHYEKSESLPGSSSTVASSIPIPPPMPPADYFSNLDASKYEIYFRETTETFPTESMHTMQVLPIEVIEKPVIIHESIRQEQIEEIQPVVRVEREKTEIRQITQPLTDKEIRPVFIEERTLPVEVLPTIVGKAVSAPERLDVSTRDFDATVRHVVEKAPIVQETEKWRIIEEVQPVIYREVIVPHVIRTSRPMREVIVEAPIFTEQVLSSRGLSAAERQRWSSFFAKETISREMTSIPVTTIVEPQVLRVVAEQPMSHHKKEIVEEVVTTTTTTTVAPTVAASSSRSNVASSSSTSSSTPSVVNESHDVKVGPKGEMITRDSFTTTSSVVLPTRAN